MTMYIYIYTYIYVYNIYCIRSCYYTHYTCRYMSHMLPAAWAVHAVEWKTWPAVYMVQLIVASVIDCALGLHMIAETTTALSKYD